MYSYNLKKGDKVLITSLDIPAIIICYDIFPKSKLVEPLLSAKDPSGEIYERIPETWLKLIDDDEYTKLAVMYQLTR
jgi:hypothetical protein